MLRLFTDVRVQSGVLDIHEIDSRLVSPTYNYAISGDFDHNNLMQVIIVMAVNKFDQQYRSKIKNLAIMFNDSYNYRGVKLLIDSDLPKAIIGKYFIWDKIENMDSSTKFEDLL